MIEVMRQQYAMVQQPRSILFEFLQEVVGNDGLNRVFPEFDNKSIRDLLEHTAGCYSTWLGFHALGHPRASFDHGPCTSMDLGEAELDDPNPAFATHLKPLSYRVIIFSSHILPILRAEIRVKWRWIFRTKSTAGCKTTKKHSNRYFITITPGFFATPSAI